MPARAWPAECPFTVIPAADAPAGVSIGGADAEMRRRWRAYPRLVTALRDALAEVRCYEIGGGCDESCHLRHERDAETTECLAPPQVASARALLAGLEEG